MFSNGTQIPMRANSTSWEAYKDLSFSATYEWKGIGMIQAPPLRPIEWKGIRMIQGDLSSYACQLNVPGSIQGEAYKECCHWHEIHQTASDQIGPHPTASDHIRSHLTAFDCIRLHSPASDRIHPHQTALDRIRSHLIASDCIHPHSTASD